MLLSNDTGVGVSPTGPTGLRDVRLDFFRGLALLCIFIDHTPGNILGFVTARAYGLSDAAEMFVLIAGYTAVLAYSRIFEREGMLRGAGRIGRRMRDLYAAHLLLTVVCAILLAVAAQSFENPLYYEHVNLTPYAYDPLGAIWRTLALYYQLGYLNILPLYIVLLAWFPLLWWLMQRHLGLALAASAILWLSANVLGANLPSWPELYGWYFNPFAWQLLFQLGRDCCGAHSTWRGAAAHAVAGSPGGGPMPCSVLLLRHLGSISMVSKEPVSFIPILWVRIASRVCRSGG